MDLLSLLKDQIGSNIVDQLAKDTNASPEQTDGAVNGILSTLLGGLMNNASTPEGADALGNALDRDHSGGGILGGLLDFVTGGNVQPENEKAANGAGIIGHIFGDKTGSVVEGLSKSTGLDTSKIGELLIKVAPMVMGVLGSLKSKNNMNSSDIGGLLNRTVQENKSSNPIFDMATKMLDKDGDGNMMDDLGSIGMSVLGGLFKK